MCGSPLMPVPRARAHIIFYYPGRRLFPCPSPSLSPNVRGMGKQEQRQSVKTKLPTFFPSPRPCPLSPFCWRLVLCSDIQVPGGTRRKHGTGNVLPFIPNHTSPISEDNDEDGIKETVPNYFVISRTPLSD